MFVKTEKTLFQEKYKRILKKKLTNESPTEKKVKNFQELASVLF